MRQELHFLLIGWVLMPEHFHVLIKPEPAETTPLIMKGLKEESAKRMHENAAGKPSIPLVPEHTRPTAAALNGSR